MAKVGTGNIATIAPFQTDSDPTSTAQRWSRWVQRLENLFVALNITVNGRKRLLLPHLAGEAMFDIFGGLIVSPIAEDADPAVDNACTATNRALDAHFSPKRNVEFEVYTFRLARQNVGESMNTYQARLRASAKYCEFVNLDGS